MEAKVSKLLFIEQNKKLQEKRVREEMANFMRKWSFAKARRQADVSAKIERANNAALSLIK